LSMPHNSLTTKVQSGGSSKVVQIEFRILAVRDTEVD
jgi:hypothetical protein